MFCCLFDLHKCRALRGPVHYQVLVRLADFRLKVLGLVLVRVAVCGAQAAEEVWWKLEAFGLLLLHRRRLLFPHHLAVWLCTQGT